MAEKNLAVDEKKKLDNTDNSVDNSNIDLLDVFVEQIRNMAYENQFGNLVIDFKVRNGVVKEAHRVSESIKLRPY